MAATKSTTDNGEQIGEQIGADNGATVDPVTRIAFGSADGDRIAGLIGTVTFHPATVAAPKRPARTARFTFHAAVDAPAMARKSTGTVKRSVSTNDVETAAILAAFGIDSTAPTVALVEAAEGMRGLQTSLSAAARSIAPVSIALPGEPVLTVDDATVASLLALALAD
jgi:hypothetical protein